MLGDLEYETQSRRTLCLAFTLIILILIFYYRSDRISFLNYLKSYEFEDCLQYKQTDTRHIHYIRRNVLIQRKPSKLAYKFSNTYFELPDLVKKLFPVLKKQV